MKRYTLEKTLPLRLLFVDTENHLLDTRTFKLKYTLLTTVSEDEHDITAQMGQNISLTKINFFIEHYLNNSIAIDVDDRKKFFPLFVEFENNYLVLPDMTESTLMETLHAKLNSLCKPCSRIEQIHLFDSLNDVNYTFYISEDDEYNLPDHPDWIGELSFWPDPWWRRDDLSTYDNCAESREELEKWRTALVESENDHPAVCAFKDIEEAVKGSFQEALEAAGLVPKVERGQLIEVDFVNTTTPPRREKWTPRII